MTLDEIRRKGLAALKKELGLAGMLKFMKQFSNGSGNYVVERHEWVDSMSMDDLMTQIKAKRKKRKRAS